MGSGERPDDLIVAVLAHAQFRQGRDIVPSAEGRPVAATIAERRFAAGVGEELARVWAAGWVFFCAGCGAVEEVDEADEARACGYEVAYALLGFRACWECVPVAGHQDAHVAGAAAADLEAWEVCACVWVDDAVPGLVGDDAAGAGA